jgi:hypothetical protein
MMATKIISVIRPRDESTDVRRGRFSAARALARNASMGTAAPASRMVRAVKALRSSQWKNPPSEPAGCRVSIMVAFNAEWPSCLQERSMRYLRAGASPECGPIRTAVYVDRANFRRDQRRLLTPPNRRCALFFASRRARTNQAAADQDRRIAETASPALLIIWAAPRVFRSGARDFTFARAAQLMSSVPRSARRPCNAPVSERRPSEGRQRAPRALQDRDHTGPLQSRAAWDAG